MAIRHVVAWQLAATDPDIKREQATKIANDLVALGGVIPEILAITAGPEALYEQNWDVALVADFASKADLEAYQVHPAHQAIVGFVRSVVSNRVAVDFEI